MPIFDIHQHVRGPDGGAQAMDAFDIDQDARIRLRLLDRFDVAGAALLPTATFERPNGIGDLRAFNNLMAATATATGIASPLPAAWWTPWLGPILV
jgi:hypothetical protein